MKKTDLLGPNPTPPLKKSCNATTFIKVTCPDFKLVQII